jgi:hypothetical protein
MEKVTSAEASPDSPTIEATRRIASERGMDVAEADIRFKVRRICHVQL